MWYGPCNLFANAHTTEWKKKKLNFAVYEMQQCCFGFISTFFNHIHHKYNVKSKAFDFQFFAIHRKFRGLQAPKFDSPQIVYNKSNWGPKEDISLGLLCVPRSALNAKVIDNGFHCIIIMLLIQNHLNFDK